MNMNANCKGMKLNKKVVAPTTEQKIVRLMKLIDEDEKECFEQLNLLFGCSRYLTSEFVLTAIIHKLEGDREEGEIDEHMQVEWDTAWDLANKMYASWFFGFTDEQSDDQ